MKKLLLLLLLPLASSGQTILLIHGTNSFNIGSAVFPLGSVVLNVRPDSANIELDIANIPPTFPPYAYNRVIIAPKALASFRLDGVACSTLVQMRTWWNTYAVASGGGGSPTGAAGGDLAGTYPNPTINVNQPYVWGDDQTISIGGLGASITDGLVIKNPTPGTDGDNNQYPPALKLLGAYSDGIGGSSNAFGFRINSTCDGSVGIILTNFDLSLDDITYTTALSFYNSGFVVNTIFNSDAAFNSGKTIKMTTSGSNNAAGTATLSSGTVTVSTTAVKTGDIIHINYTDGTALSLGIGNISIQFIVPTITNGTSFVINAVTVTGTVNTTDNSSVQWQLIHTQ